MSPTLFNTVPTLRSQYQHTAQHFTSGLCLTRCPAQQTCIRHNFIFDCKNVNITSLSMPTSHIGTDIIQLHSLLIFAFGGEWSTSRSGRCVSREAFRRPLIRVEDGHHRLCGRYGEEKNTLHPPGFKPLIVQPIA